MFKRVEEEKQLVANLKDICKRMQKGNRELGAWKDNLRSNAQRQKKKKEKLENKLVKAQMESRLFYSRAKREAYS